MSKDFSFDIISDYNLSEVRNAVEQTQRIIAQRYDFKGTPAELELKEQTVMIKGEEHQLDIMLDMLRTSFAKRGIDQKTLDNSEDKQAGNPWRWTIKLKKGISSENAKVITKLIRDNNPKVKSQIQSDAVRVTSSSKDDLQAVMVLVKKQDFDFPIGFDNYR